MCIPKSIGDSAALLAADVGTITALNAPLEFVIDRLATLIVHWNTEYQYCLYRITGKQACEGNCQDFVDAVLSTLGISFKPTGALKICIETMRKKGIFETRYTPDPKLREALSLNESYLFDTHEELDMLVQEIVSREPGFKVDYSDDYALLKSFDRYGK